MIINDRKNVYSKIKEMIMETSKELDTVTTVASLVRADRYGLLEAVFNHPLKSQIQFRFLTHITELNYDLINNLLQRAPKTGFNFKGRNI